MLAGGAEDAEHAHRADDEPVELTVTQEVGANGQRDQQREQPEPEARVRADAPRERGVPGPDKRHRAVARERRQAGVELDHALDAGEARAAGQRRRAHEREAGRDSEQR